MKFVVDNGPEQQVLDRLGLRTFLSTPALWHREECSIQCPGGPIFFYQLGLQKLAAHDRVFVYQFCVSHLEMRSPKGDGGPVGVAIDCEEDRTTIADFCTVSIDGAMAAIEAMIDGSETAAESPWISPFVDAKHWQPFGALSFQRGSLDEWHMVSLVYWSTPEVPVDRDAYEGWYELILRDGMPAPRQIATLTGTASWHVVRRLSWIERGSWLEALAKRPMPWLWSLGVQTDELDALDAAVAAAPRLEELQLHVKNITLAATPTLSSSTLQRLELFLPSGEHLHHCLEKADLPALRALVVDGTVLNRPLDFSRLSDDLIVFCQIEYPSTVAFLASAPVLSLSPHPSVTPSALVEVLSARGDRPTYVAQWAGGIKAVALAKEAGIRLISDSCAVAPAASPLAPSLEGLSLVLTNARAWMPTKRLSASTLLSEIHESFAEPGAWVGLLIGTDEVDSDPPAQPRTLGDVAVLFDARRRPPEEQPQEPPLVAVPLSPTIMDDLREAEALRSPPIRGAEFNQTQVSCPCFAVHWISPCGDVAMVFRAFGGAHAPALLAKVVLDAMRVPPIGPVVDRAQWLVQHAHDAAMAVLDKSFVAYGSMTSVAFDGPAGAIAHLGCGGALHVGQLEHRWLTREHVVRLRSKGPGHQIRGVGMTEQAEIDVHAFERVAGDVIVLLTSDVKDTIHAKRIAATVRNGGDEAAPYLVNQIRLAPSGKTAAVVVARC